MKLNKVIGVIVFLSLFLCAGCDSREIDETAYIIALGVDKNEASGYSYTFQFSAPLEAVGGKGSMAESGKEEEGEAEENATVRNVVINAEDFYTAKNMTNNFMGKNVDMSHLKLIVFSEGVDKEGFLKHSQFLLREREIRPHTAVALSKGSAKDYLGSVRPELEANTAKYYELMSINSKNVYSPKKRLSEFVDELLSEKGVSFLPIACISSELQKDEDPQNESMWVGTKNSSVASSRTELRGMAIFKDKELSTLADGDFAMVYNILSGGIKNCTISLKNPYKREQIISFKITAPQKATYDVKVQKKSCRILVGQGIDIEFLGGLLPEGFSSYDDLYAYAKSVITERFTEYFYDLSRGKRTDIMKIGDQFEKEFLTEKDWKNSGWEKLFEKAEYEVNVYFI